MSVLFSQPADIKRNLNALYERLQVEPVVVNANTLYGVVDYTLVRSLVFSSLYNPYDSFKPLADALAQLAAGNGTAMLSLRPPQVPNCSSDPHERDWERVDEGFATVACNDGDAASGSIKGLEEHHKKLLEVTEFADVWGQLHASCVYVVTIQHLLHEYRLTWYVTGTGPRVRSCSEVLSLEIPAIPCLLSGIPLVRVSRLVLYQCLWLTLAPWILSRRCASKCPRAQRAPLTVNDHTPFLALRR
jgi:hypothetical protein